MLAAWIVRVRWAHPLWTDHSVTVIHLRDEPWIKKKAIKFYPEAAYELAVAALDPDKDWWNTKKGMVHWRVLEPLNVCKQFHEVNDDEAGSVAKEVVQHILNDGVSPDSDFSTYWNGFVDGAVRNIVRRKIKIN